MSWQPCHRELCPWCILKVPHFADGEARSRALHLNELVKGGCLPPMAGFIAMHAGKWAASEMENFPAVSASAQAAVKSNQHTFGWGCADPGDHGATASSSSSVLRPPPPPPGIPTGPFGEALATRYKQGQNNRPPSASGAQQYAPVWTGPCGWASPHPYNWGAAGCCPQPMPTRHWQYWHGNGLKWQRYSASNQRIINAAYDAGHASATISSHGREYVLDLRRWKQSNEYTGGERNIRIEEEADD